MRLRTLAGLAVAIVAGIFAVAYAPTNLGGHTTYVSTYGTSMLPRFHAGDLAVVKPASRYRVGDVVAYRSTVLDDKIVLHRIVAADDGHFTMKGDNNDFDDPVHPTADQIVGRLRVRIPKGGQLRALVARPLILFPLVALAIGCASSGLFLRKQRRQSGTGHDRRQPSATPPPGSRRRLHIVVPVAAAVAAIGFVVAIASVWGIPAREPTTRTANYTQRLGVGYSGTAAKGAVYPFGTVHTGDPVFTRLVQAIAVDVDYDLSGDQAVRAVHGTCQLMVTVSSATGWSSTFALTPAAKFAGAHMRTTAHLSIARLRDVEARVAAETGLDTSQAAISIAPRVQARGRVGTAAFASDVTTKLDFALSPIAMTPTATGPAAAAAANVMAKNGSVRIASTRAGALSIASLRIPVGAAKLAVLVALALALAAAAAVLVIDRERVALGEVAAIERRYGRFIIPVGALPPTGDRTLVAVESMRALAQLAHVEERPIVRGTVGGRVRFTLTTDAVVYTYDAAPSRPVVAATAA
jgi:signal peptidase I